MAVLAIDTSAAVAVALTDDDGARLASRSVDSPRHHAELLAPMIREVLAEAGLSPADLTAVVAGTGPAPFTGLRAGLVTARMIALARAVPLYGVSSLDALAAELFLAPSAPLASEAGSDVVAVADARRREVYAARYRPLANDGDVELVAGPVVDRPDVVIGALAASQRGASGHAPHAENPAVGASEDAVVVGAGASLYPEAFPGARGPLAPDPTLLARLAIVRARRGVDQPAEPLYLRRPDAVPASGRKRASA